MGARTFHQHDVGSPASSKFVAEPRNEFQSGSAAANNDDAMRSRRRCALACRIDFHRIAFI
jgi:hypothetical protein